MKVRKRVQSRLSPRGEHTRFDFRRENGVWGYYPVLPPVPIGQPVQTLYRETEDYIGKKKRVKDSGLPSCEHGLTPVSPLNSTFIRRTPNFLSINGSSVIVKFQPSDVSHLSINSSVPGPVERATRSRQLALKLWAETNPYRFEVSVPVMVSEFLEMATLFKFAIGNFAGQVAGNFLNIQFGWKPFLADLQTLATVTQSIESRMLELESMRKHGGLRRGGIFLHADVIRNTIHPQYPAVSHGSATWYGVLHQSASYRVAGSCRWGYRGEPPSMTKLETFNLALKKVLDLEVPDSATIWEMIPFSWLIDYFIDLSDWFNANQGYGEIYPFDTCITYRGRGKFVWTENNVVNASPSMRLSPSSCGATRLDVVRDVVQYDPSVFPTPTLAFFTESQAANIMALLTVLRKKR